MSIKSKDIPSPHMGGQSDEQQAHRAERRRQLLRLLGLYLEDLLARAGGSCLVASAAVARGLAAALATAGGLLLFYALVVARASRRR